MLLVVPVRFRLFFIRLSLREVTREDQIADSSDAVDKLSREQPYICPASLLLWHVGLWYDIQ